MPLYRTSSKEFFMNCVADFVLNNFRDNLADIKIILPNGYLCNYLQNIIIDKNGTTILPSIIPVIEITSEGNETFKIPSEQIGKITSLEERMILAQVIHSYDKLGYDLAQSLTLSSSLARLFFELEANNVNLKMLKDIPIIEQAQHWHLIYDFLEFAYHNSQQKIIETKKLSPAYHHKLMLDAELGRVKNEHILVIAGVIGNNQITQDFITKVASLKNGHVILPPTPSVELNILNLKSEDPLYNLAKLIRSICPKFLDLPLLDSKTPSILDNLLIDIENNISSHDAIDPLVKPGDDKTAPGKDIFLEFPHTLNEAEYIATECRNQIAKNPNTKIAILITNEKTKNYFTAKLVKYGIEFTDLIGNNILELPIVTLILEIAENLCKSFYLKSFVSLISHPLVINDEARKLKKLIIKENRFASSVEEIQRHCEASKKTRQSQEIRVMPVVSPEIASDYDGIEKLLTLCHSLELKSQNFHAILRQIIDTVQELCPNLWHDSANQKIVGAIEEILNTSWSAWDLDEHNLESLPELIKSLLLGGKIRNEKKATNIVICSPGDVTLMNYDLLIYTNFVENSYPKPQFISPWLNNQMAKELGLEAEYTRFGNTMYDFYLNLHNKKILITRSIKTDDAGISLPSPFLLRLKHVLGWSSGTSPSALVSSPGLSGGSILSSYVAVDPLDKPGDDTRASGGKVGRNNLPPHNNIPFPSQISATDIEMLIRAPYNFYAKKILNLKVEQEIEDNPKLSEFGNFFHKIVQLYTDNNSNSLESYSKQLLFNSTYPKQTQKFWQFKIESMAKDFVAFDNQRRSKNSKIYSEVRGEIEWDIADTRMKIVAIADRIEITEQNKGIILDYKTGAVPSKQDLLSGLSPQLIIEAIILLEGGFVNISQAIETESIIYVKINSSSPFVSITEINITKDDILEHKEKLIQLLTHYITTGEYSTLKNLMKYDDYWHLGRRE